jgi:thymidylate kinase
MQKAGPTRFPVLISFSGIDGAGKTTQIENLHSALEQRGLRTSLVTFWDDVVVLARYRESFVHNVYGSEPGVGVPGRPVNRRDKNIRRWYLTLSRYFLYSLDALHLCQVVTDRLRSDADVVIFDRYIYDEIANLPLETGFSRLLAKWLGAIAPRPQTAFVLDAEPAAAIARKPEYPLDFMRHCRRSYALVAKMLRLNQIPPLPLVEAKAAVVEQALAAIRERAAERALAVPDAAPAA